MEHHKYHLSRYLLKTCTYLLLQIAVSQEDFIMLPGPSQDAHRRKVEHSYTGLYAQASREDNSSDSTQRPVQQVKRPWLYRMNRSLPENSSVFYWFNTSHVIHQLTTKPFISSFASMAPRGADSKLCSTSVLISSDISGSTAGSWNVHKSHKALCCIYVSLALSLKVWGLHSSFIHNTYS